MPDAVFKVMSVGTDDVTNAVDFHGDLRPGRERGTGFRLAIAGVIAGDEEL